MNELTEDDLVRVLKEPDNSLISEYEALLQSDGVTLEVRHEALREIAREAVKRHTGARGLRSIVEGVMENIMFTAPEKNGKRCVVTKNTIKSKKAKYI